MCRQAHVLKWKTEFHRQRTSHSIDQCVVLYINIPYFALNCQVPFYIPVVNTAFFIRYVNRALLKSTKGLTNSSCTGHSYRSGL